MTSPHGGASAPSASPARHREKHRGPGWSFHPFELGFVGYSGSGKTTLLSRLVARSTLRLGYVKHDAHHFTMDHPGKDTHVLSEAGAHAVAISNASATALLTREPATPQLACLDLLSCDAVLLEGHRESPVPRVLVLDDRCEVLSDQSYVAQPPLAALGPWREGPELPWSIPYFHRDDLNGIESFVQSAWLAKVHSTPLLGLVLTGGKSTRMGTDKAALVYGQEPEARRVFRILESHCQQVFVSCRADQSELPGRVGLPQLHDVVLDRGPLSGMLSAFQARPDAAWLVVGCDLPRLEEGTISKLVAERNPYRFATAYQGHRDLPEPLCALYEPKSRARLLQFWAAGTDCPRKMLINSRIQLLPPPASSELDNVNDPSERARVLHDLSC